MILLQTYLVEDSAVIRESLIATLEELAPVQVVGFADDEGSALRWLAAHSVDLVIVDLFLKGGSGLGVLHAARGTAHAQPSDGSIHFKKASVGRRYVVLSNYATPALRERCLALGADGVFDKSTEIEALIAYCQTLAQQQQQ